MVSPMLASCLIINEALPVYAYRKSDGISIIPQISPILEWECYVLIDKVYVSISWTKLQKIPHYTYKRKMAFEQRIEYKPILWKATYW